MPSIKNKLKRRKSSNLSLDILENVAISQVICAIQIKSLDHLEGVTLKDNYWLLQRCKDQIKDDPKTYGPGSKKNNKTYGPSFRQTCPFWVI